MGASTHSGCQTAPMATLLDLTQQGDVGTVSNDAYVPHPDAPADGPAKLYELWERQQWQSQGIDLERDKRWAEIPDDEKEDHLWG